MAKMLIIFLATLIILLCGFYRYEIRPMDKSGNDISFEVNDGDTWYSISDKLYYSGLIRSTKFYKIYIKLFTPGNIEKGVYNLSAKMDLPTIIETLETEAVNPNITSITIKEGVNMREVANVIASNTSNTYDDFMELMTDSDYIDSLIEEYWFLEDDIKDEDIYYPLEGYIFPSTYNIDKTSDSKTIVKTILDHMDLVLLKYKNDIQKSNFSIHEILTLASIVELEAGTKADRADVAGVFINRINNDWSLGSDVTTYYALKIDDFNYSLTNRELATCNEYNTRSNCVTGLPIGPIGNAGAESIEAVLNPTKTSMYYFVADCSGKTYLTETLTAHNNIISKLESENNWCQ